LGGLAKSGFSKTIGRALPGIGLIISGMGAYDRIKKGDYSGAAMEMGIGALGTIVPGFGGVAASLLGYTALGARDNAMATEAQTSELQAMGSQASQGQTIVIKELVVKSELKLDKDVLAKAVRTIVNKKLQPETAQ